MSTCIYALIDPYSREAKYVGKTTTSINNRLSAHISRPVSKTMGIWVDAITAQGLKPEIIILESGLSDREWSDAEQFWISNLRFLGAKLFNVKEGGGFNIPCRKRIKKPMVPRSITMETQKWGELDNVAKSLGTTPSELVRKVVNNYIKKRKASAVK